MAGEESGNGDRAGGARNVSVGFGASPANVRPVASPPPYRILIAGDFGLAREGERHAVGRRDIADLMETLRPELEVTVENRLGSFPVGIAVPIRLDGPRALRPSSVVAGFVHHRRALESLKTGEALADGAAYDRLAALLAGTHTPEAAREADRTAEVAAKPEDGDDLDALFGMVDTSGRRDDGGDRASPRGRLQDYIDANITRAERGAAPARKSAGPDAATALLDEQARLLLSDERLRTVLENWHGLRTLMEAAGAEIELTLVQIRADADAPTLEASLAGNAGALHADLFDLLLLANRCAAKGAGAETLRRAAAAAAASGICALATLRADFAGVEADRLAAMDAPHQLLEASGFESFRALRSGPDAANVALFWNDVLAVEESAANPALFMPAAWLAAAFVVANVREYGWPRLRASARSELTGFPVHQVAHQGRDVALATRALASPDSAGGLAAAGVAALVGRIDRDSVQLLHLPLLSPNDSDEPYAPKIGDRLVFTRITTLIQSVLPAALGDGDPPAEKATRVHERLDDLARAITESPNFSVSVATDEEGAPMLDIAVRLPRGMAARERFDFQIAI